MNEPKIDIGKWFLIPRFEVVATYPGMGEKIGDVKCPSNIEKAEYFKDHPAIYKELKWFEKRGLSEFLHIEFIEVKTKGYYVPGDKLKVFKYLFEDLDGRNPRIVGFAASIEDCIIMLSKNVFQQRKRNY